MGVFNFSNMQDTNEQSKENLYIPVEFRQDNNNEIPDNKYVGTNNDKAASNNGYLPGGSNGFIDETGTWNYGSSLYQYKTTETQWNQSIAGQLVNSNAYKKYFYNREDVLQEAKTMAGALKIPENAILKDANTLAKTREIYNYQQRQLNKDEVFKAYPELSRIAEKSDTDAAIALHNLKNIKETRDIFEAMKIGLELDELNSTRGRIGFKGMNGAELTEEDYKKIDEIDKRMAELPKLPGLLESPLAAIAGGTAQTGRLMLRNFFNGQKMGAYGAGFGAILGAVGAGSATLGTGAAAGAIAGARLGYSIGSRIGMAQDMYDEVAGNNYLDFKKYTDKNGRQLLTDNQARVYGATAAAVETFIEYSNADKILEVIKGTGAENTIRQIIKAAKNNTELYSMLTAFIKKGVVNTGKVAVPETIEEGVQEASNRIITNIMALNNPGGDIPVYSTRDILIGAVESMWAALPASIGLGAAAQGASTMRMGRQIAKVLSLKNEHDKANYKNANGLSMLRQLKEYIVNSELNKKNPELQKEVLTQQLADSGMETLAVDTDMVLNQQGGYELLKEVADKAGISEEVFNQIVETRSDMTISTAVYAQTILPDEIAGKLEDYITFDAAGECLARNRQYASRIRRLADELLDTESQRRMETLTTFLDSNFRNDQEREVAEAVLMRYPDNPAEGVKALRKQIQGQIDAMLEPVLARMQEGMGNGVSIIYVDDEGNPTTEEYAARGIRASNNEGWYSEFYKDYGRAPTKQEMKDIARDILTGRSSYQVAGWEYQNGAEEYYEQNREHLEKLDESIERLNALAPRLEKIDPGELTITEGLSKEGYEVYKMTAEKLLSSASKQSRAAARMSAILYARMADRMAELYREAGYKKYTALDFAKRITLDTTGQGSNGSVFNQWSTDNDIIIGDKQEFDKQISEIKNKYVNTPQWMKAPNGEPTKLTEQQWLAVRTPAFIEKYGDWVTLHKNKLELIKWTQNYEGLKQIVSKIRDKDLFNASTGISAKLSKRGKNKIISGMARRLSELNGYTDDEHYTVVANMEQLFESAILSEHQQDKYGEIAGIDLYSSYCEINNKPAVAIFTVKETNNAGKTLYTVQLTEIKKPTGTLPRLVKKRSSATVGFSDINITQLAKKFKNIRSYIGENGEPDLSKLAGISLEQRDYNAIKQAQLDIINQNNAMQDNYHTGIRTIDDILSADEALNVTQEALDNYEVEAYSYPDFSLKDGKRALKTGRIRVYSSKPITPGAFITPSKMMAQDYAGDGRVYSKVIPLEDVAFINADEGQYAPVSSSFNQKGTDLDSVYIGNQYTMQRPAQEVLGAYNELINHEEIDLSDTVIEGSDIKEKRKRAKELCNRIYEKDGVKEPIQDKYGQEILVVRGTGTEILKHSANEDILALIPNFKKIIPNAVLLYDSEPIPTRVKHMMDYVDYYKTYGTMVKINNTSYFVKLLVRVQKNGQVILHDADLSKIEKTKAEPKGPSDATYDVALMPKGSTFVENSIPWWINEVKTKLISANNIQQNGNIKFEQRAYHGSPAKFDKFDLGSIGSGAGTNMHGWGIYFTKLKKVADGYKKALGKSKDKTTYQVDVPDDNYLLDENLSFNQQYQEVQEGIVKCLNKLTDNQKNIFWESILKYRLSSSSGLIKANKDYQNARAVYDAIDQVSSKPKFAFIAKKAEKTLFTAGYTIQDIERFKNDNNYREHEKNKYKDGIAKQKALLDSAQNDNDEKHRQLVKQAIINPREFLKDNTINGQRIYNSLAQALSEEGAEMVDQKLASLHLNNYGVKGISYDGGPDGRCFVVFDDRSISIIEKYNQAAGHLSRTMNKVVGLKGQTTIKANGERVISLFKAADQSTFMHEAAHLFLSEMIALAKTPNAPERLHKDLQTIASWANWNEGQISEYVGTYLEKEFTQLNSEIKEAMAKGSAAHNGQEMSLEQLKTIWMQERFARGFENYLKQGKAPTAAIQSVFSKFKSWLSNIYRSFKQLGGAPTKEVRAVMDRMIATQDEVEIEMKKRGVNDFVKNGGMDYLAEDSQALYNRMVARAKEEAESKVLKVAMKDIREDYQKQQQEYLAQAEADYREELSTEPVFRVQEHMKNNPGLSTSAVCQSLGLTLQEYIAKLDEYGGNIDAAVETYMKQLRVDVENTPIDEADLRTKAEEAVQGSYYRKMVTALELNAFENIAKAQRTLNRKIAKDLGEVDAKEAAEAMKKLTAKEKMEAGLRAVRDVAEGHYRDYVEYVKSKLETMPISDANNYKMWRRKSAEALDMANHAMTKGNWEQAVNCKKQQLIYDLFADEAVKNAKYVDKLEQTLARRQVTMSNNLNMPADERYVYNHLLFVFGFVKKDAAMPPEYKGFTNTLMKRDETLECPFVGEDGTLDLPDWILSAGSGTQARAAGHGDLTMQQLKDLAQLMKVIYKTGMEADKLRTAKDVHGNTVGLRDAIRQIAREAEQRVLLKNDKDITGAQGKTKLEQALDAANAAHVALLKPETIFRQLGESAMRYIYNPLKAAADKELKLSGEMQKDLTKLFSVYSKEEMHEMRTEKKYRLGTSLLTKERLIMLGLNWGTYISQQRIMAGHNVSSYEVNEVLSNLDQRDWELITGIWALYEKHWPELQAGEARLTGAVLEKQEAFPFTVLGKDGTKYNIPGGYFPLKYDASKNASVAERTEDIAKQATMAGFALGIGRSMTKERSQGRVALPLDLRFDVISKTLSDEIHLISFREPVRDARRIILNDEFTALIQGIYGVNTVSMLRKWSADCWALEPVPQTGFERVMSMLRGNMTMAVLGYRTMTAILNVLNLAPMAHYLGSPAEAMRAMKRFYANPREMYAYITQESVFMAERAMTMDVNIREAIQKGTTADMLPGYKAVQENAFRLIAMTDLSIAMPLWLREYEKTYQNALDNGLKPESAKRDAVLAGDAAVRRVFGSSQKIDLSAVQRGSEIMKCMTMYYSYFSTLYNALAYMTYETRQKVMGAKIRSGSWKKAVAENKKQLLKGLAPLANGLLMWILIPSIMEALLRPIADDDKDKWSIDKLALKTGKNIVSNLVGGIPVLRDAVPYLLAKAFNEPQYSMGTLPAYNTVEQLNKVIQSIASDKKTIYDVARESLRLTSTFIGFSTTLSDGLATTIEWAGTDFEASIPEYLRAVIFDRKIKKK